MTRLVAFKPIFPSPFGYCNFGEENRELNQQLIKDINYDKSINDYFDTVLSLEEVEEVNEKFIDLK